MTTDITELALLVSKAKASVFTLEYISQFEPADIDSDDVDLRFEVDGRDTGTNVSIVDECGQAARVIGALVEALEKAQSAGSINNQWKPDACPITGRRFFMWIEHPELGYVPTYGGPYDSYTIPTRDGDGEFSCERYDHDVGGWVDGECVGAYLIDDDEQCRVYELEQRIAELEPINAAAEKLVRCKGRYHSELNYRALAALFGVTTPDLPPLDGESRIVKLPAACADDEYFIDGVFQPLRYERDVERALTAAGIKWEAE